MNIMNLEEFNLKKESLVEHIIFFEQLQRKINLLNTTYKLEFHKEIEEQMKLNFENDALLQGISMKASGKSNDEIQSVLDQIKNAYFEQQRKLYQQYNSAKALEKQCSKYTPKDMETLDETFKTYCTKYHPLVHLKATEAERGFYPLLITVYRMGNLEGFKNLLKENESLLTEFVILSEEYDAYAKEYLSTIQNLREMVSKLQQEFPLNKEEMFYKEESLIREQMELREKIYQTKDMNKALHKDFILNFEFDFKL